MATPFLDEFRKTTVRPVTDRRHFDNTDTATKLLRGKTVRSRKKKKTKRRIFSTVKENNRSVFTRGSPSSTHCRPNTGPVRLG